MNLPTWPASLHRIIQTLLRWRWVIWLFALLTILLFELFEGHTLTDPHFIVEVLLYGVFLPFPTWLILTLLAREMAHQQQIEDRLARYRHLAQQLAHHQDWDELTRFVAQFPSTLLPVEHTALFIYDHPNARLNLAATWKSPGQTTTSPWIVAETCETCLISRAPQMHPCGQGAILPDLGNGALASHFCLPLYYTGLLVGVLHLSCQPDRAFTQAQIDFMNVAAPEIALALILSLAHPQQLAQVRAATQRDTRHRIAHLLHNSLAQQLGFLHLGLDRLAGDHPLASPDTIRAELEDMRQVAKATYQQVRDMLSLLRAEDDPAEGIAGYARGIIRDNDLSIEVTAPSGTPRQFPPRVRQALFGLLEEGLNNIEKHARAQKVNIALSWSEDGLTMSLMDNGIGFVPTAILQAEHYGIAMMREQAQELGGELTIESAPGQGTRLEFRLPLQRFLASPPKNHVANPDLLP